MKKEKKQMEGYSVKIVDVNKDLTAKERIMLKQTDGCTQLNEVVGPENLIIKPVMWAELEVHNENAKEGSSKDYTKYLIVDENGEKYTTGSRPFWDSFKSIVSELDGCDEEWAITVGKRQSKNYKGEFLTCGVV